MKAEIAVGILTAAAALGGAVISQAFSLLESHQDRKHKRQLLLQEKLEQLTEHLNASLAWANVCADSLLSEQQPLVKDPISARQIYTLCLLFFWPLKPHASEYLNACLELLSTLSKAARGEPSDPKAASQRLGLARAALDTAIETFAREQLSK